MTGTILGRRPATSVRRISALSYATARRRDSPSPSSLIVLATGAPTTDAFFVRRIQSEQCFWANDHELAYLPAPLQRLDKRSRRQITFHLLPHPPCQLSISFVYIGERT